MKTNIRFVNTFLVCGIICIQLLSCSKDSIEEKPLNAYNSPKDFFQNKKQKEEEYTIDTNGSCPLITKYGARICPIKSHLKYPDRDDSVYFPFTLKMIELYTAKDIIYYEMQTMSGQNILANAGELKIRAFKDTTELSLRSSKTWPLTIPGKNTMSDMKQYYGYTNKDKTDWITDPIGDFSKDDTSYSCLVQKVGWLAGAHEASTRISGKITFTSTTDILINVAIFIYIPSTKTVMQVANLVSDQIPSGTDVKIVAIAVNSSNQLYSFYKQLTLGQNNETINITMESISESDLDQRLNTL